MLQVRRLYKLRKKQRNEVNRIIQKAHNQYTVKTCEDTKGSSKTHVEGNQQGHQQKI